jgi:hypothetical protein
MPAPFFKDENSDASFEVAADTGESPLVFDRVGAA